MPLREILSNFSERLRKTPRQVFSVFSPKRPPSLVTIAIKAGTGWMFIKMSEIIEFFSPTPDNALSRQNSLYFLQGWSFSGILRNTGQAFLVNSALDASKLTLITAHKGLHQLIKTIAKRKAKNKLEEIEEALKKQSENRNKKKERREQREQSKWLTEKKRLQDFLKAQDDLIIPEQYYQDSIKRVSFYGSIVIENAANIVMLVSCVDPLSRLLRDVILNHSDFSKSIEFFIDQNEDHMFFPEQGHLEYYGLEINRYSKLSNYFFSPKIALLILTVQLILNTVDFKNQRKDGNLLGSKPINALIQSGGVQYNVITFKYKISRLLAHSHDGFVGIRNFMAKDSETLKTVIEPLYDEKYAEALLKTGSKELAKRYASIEVEEFRILVLGEVKDIIKSRLRWNNIFDLFGFYGQHKFLTNIFHVMDNLFDLLDNKTLFSEEVNHSDFNRRIIAVQSDLRRRPNRGDQEDQYEYPRAKIQAVSYQPQGVQFPEETMRARVKVKTQGTPNLHLSPDFAPGDRKSSEEATTTNGGGESSEQREIEARKQEILNSYTKLHRVRKELFRTILDPRGLDINRTISGEDIIKLAQDLNLEVTEKNNDHKILVYKQHGAHFHTSHGKDRDGVPGDFIRELSRAFQVLGISIEDLDSMDREPQCCPNTVSWTLLQQALTTRPRLVG